MSPILHVETVHCLAIAVDLRPRAEGGGLVGIALVVRSENTGMTGGVVQLVGRADEDEAAERRSKSVAEYRRELRRRERKSRGLVPA